MDRRQFGTLCAAYGLSLGTIGLAKPPEESSTRSVEELQALAREDINQLTDEEIDEIVLSHDGPCQCPICLSSFGSPP